MLLFLLVYQCIYTRKILYLVRGVEWQGGLKASFTTNSVSDPLWQGAFSLFTTNSEGGKATGGVTPG